MKLMTKEIEASMPALYSQADQYDPICHVKYFTPDSNWTWYGMEYDPEDRIFFGYVIGPEPELGNFSLDELESARGPLGLPIERDFSFEPAPLSEIKKGQQVSNPA